MRPDHLLASEAQEDAPFTTPRSWHMLSDALHSCGKTLTPEVIQVLASGCLSPQHAGQYAAFARNWMQPYKPEEILSGMEPIPFDRHEDATFMLASVRAYLIERLPRESHMLNSETEWLALQAMELIEQVVEADLELVRYFMTPPNEEHLPRWFVDEILDIWSDVLQVEELKPANPFASPPPLPRPGSNNSSSGSSRFGRRSPFNRGNDDDDDD
jgi:hypothetical protein